MKKINYLLLLLFSLGQLPRAAATEGMWLPLLLSSLNGDEMSAMGLKLTPEDIYSVNEGSLKDAIVHFGGYCTSELISPQGLLLTNHHCGYSQIQSHSSLENNILENGFWATAQKDELPNPGLTASFIDYIEDVSDYVLQSIDTAQTEAGRQRHVDVRIDALVKSKDIASYQKVFVRPFFKGNQYFLFSTTIYRDVRLVGTPPESIGKYGADTDNWVWPRHTGDFSLFRIYAGPDNLPAEYSENNVPYRPKHYLPISLDGVEEGDFTMVFGFPGRTDQYLPSFALEQIVERVNPHRIAIRDQALKVMESYMRQDPQIKIQYASKFARIANGWKKWIGENLGLQSKNAVSVKQSREKEFTDRLARGTFPADYAQLLQDMKALYDQRADLTQARTVYQEVHSRNIELLSLGSQLLRLIDTYEDKGEEAYKNRLKRISNYLESFYKNYNPQVDRAVAAKLLSDYPSRIPGTLLLTSDVHMMNASPEAILFSSQIKDQAYIMELVENPEKFVTSLRDDPVIRYLKAARGHYVDHVAKPLARIDAALQGYQRRWMKALMDVFPEQRFWPDANSTLRLTYGTVDGYSPRDAVSYSAQTYLDGVLEKYVPDDYEFDLDDRIRSLAAERNYGRYAQHGKLPVCFIGTNHTTGGNSGSPALDAWGNLVGLNFDRVWEGTMSDLYYDAEICRNIMVDARYILWIIDVYAGAGHLVDEMSLVYPKTGK